MKKVKDKVEEVITEEPKEDLKVLEAKYNQMIAEIKPKLLTKMQLKQGGSGIRARYEQEKGYAAVLPEINELGKKIGKSPIGLGHLRK